MITRGAIKNDVLIWLNKSPKTKGFYTDERLDMGIRLSLDLVANECFTGGNGFMTKLKTLPVANNQVAVPIPADVCYINQLRFKVGDIYVPCIFDQQREQTQLTAQAGSVQYPYNYRIIDNCFYFNPGVINGASDFLQLECTVWPKVMANDSDYIEEGLNNAMYWFIVIHTATVCVNQIGQAISDWTQEHDYWFSKVQETIQRRNNIVQRIQDFE